MHKLASMVWILGSAAAAVCAALTVTLAHAGTPEPAAGAVRWSAEERAVLASLSLKRLPSVPTDPSNTVERQPAAIELGRRLFNNARLSRNGAIACASCHDPAKQFQDGLPVSQGVGTGSRRAMPIVGASHSPWLFWDGRKDSLWAQALGPLEDAVEHGTNRTRVAHLVAANHRRDYEALFGALPRLDGLPGDAGPKGSAAEQAAWAAIDPRRREDVSRVFANVGKAIATYEKSLQHEPTRLDGYLDAVLRGDAAARELLRADEARGLRLFIGKAQCSSCHNGPLFSDQQFHNTGVPPRDAARPDRGRAAATAKVGSDEFNCLGPFSDARPEQCQELRFMVSDDPALEGAFKTPGLRGVAGRPPYMHAGQFATLEQVVRHYIAAPHAAVGHSELTHRHAVAGTAKHAEHAPIELSDAEVADLVSFLGTLSADRPSAAAAATAAAAAAARPPRLEDGRASTRMGPEGCDEAACRDRPHLAGSSHKESPRKSRLCDSLLTLIEPDSVNTAPATASILGAEHELPTATVARRRRRRPARRRGQLCADGVRTRAGKVGGGNGSETMARLNQKHWRP
jgi:cytochrome c peroxidase